MLIADALKALVATELLCTHALWAKEVPLPFGTEHAFGASVRMLGSDLEDARSALAACDAQAAKGERVAAVLSAGALADARRDLSRLVALRRPIVVHVIVSPRGRAASVAGYADVHAVADVGVGVVFARDAQDGSDLAVIAHRAAEDAEAPILVVHDGYPSTYALDRVVLPDAPLLRAMLEASPPKIAPSRVDALPAHRRSARQVPFALSSSMRAFERLSGVASDGLDAFSRKLDLIQATHVEDAELIILAAGAIGETARAVVEHLRRATPPLPIGLVQLVALRPFPGAQIVKTLARVRAIAVIERIDAPLAQSNPLAMEVKAAFADALTWAPGYPGIGRIPNIYAGCVEPSLSEATPGDIIAIVDNVFRGEQGRRVFHMGASHPHDQALSPGADRHVHPDDAFAVRFNGDPSLTMHVLSALYDADARATPRMVKDDTEVFDITISPSPVRAHHGASLLDFAVLTDSRSTPADLDTVGAMREGAAVFIASAHPAVGADGPRLSKEVQAALQAKQARVFVLKAGESDKTSAVPTSSASSESLPWATLLGIILRVRPPHGLDRAQIVAHVERALSAPSLHIDSAAARSIVATVTRSMDGAAEVPTRDLGLS
ncbi:MAG: hypothetical protein NVS3B20_13700 [Polyangiales bacterium]